MVTLLSITSDVCKNVREKPRHCSISTSTPITCLLSPSFEILLNFPYLSTMKQVAVGIIMKNGQVLACQRKGTVRYPLKWEFPGGKIEQNETPEEALVRELREELSIEAALEKEFFRQDWVYPDSAGAARNDGTFRVFYFLVRWFKGEPVNRTFEQILWVSPSELQAMDILEGNREAVALLVKHAKEAQTT